MPAATATRRDTAGANVGAGLAAAGAGPSGGRAEGNGTTEGGLVIEVSSESVVNGLRHDRLNCGLTGIRLSLVRYPTGSCDIG